MIIFPTDKKPTNSKPFSIWFMTWISTFGLGLLLLMMILLILYVKTFFIACIQVETKSEVDKNEKKMTFS
jgi:hypothetical protein